MSDRNISLPWLVALSVAAGALGQMLVFSAVPRTHPMRRVADTIVRHSASPSITRHDALFPRSAGPTPT